MTSSKMALLALFLVATPFTAHALDPIVVPIGPDGKPLTAEQSAANDLQACMSNNADAVNAAAQRFIDDQDASEKLIKRKKDRLLNIQNLRSSNDTLTHAYGYSLVPGCTQTRGADLYELDGSHKIIKTKAGKEVDAVKVCEDYVEAKAKNAYQALAQSSDSKQKDTFEVFEGTPCLAHPLAQAGKGL